METIRNEHLSESEVEDYARGKLSRKDAPALLSHLLECDHCASLVEAEQDLRSDFRSAVLQEPAREEKPRRSWSQLLTFPRPAMAGAMAIALVLLVAPMMTRVDTQPQTLNLAAYRGDDPVAAAASAPLVLRLDGTGLNLGTQAEVRIVNSKGREVWSEIAKSEGSQYVTNVQQHLTRGVYWVRLSSAGDRSPAREFQLRVN